MRHTKATRTRRRPATFVTTFAAICALTLAGCAGTHTKPSEPATGESLQIALHSEPQGSAVALHYGVDNYGGDFDHDLSVDRNVTIYESNEN